MNQKHKFYLKQKNICQPQSADQSLDHAESFKETKPQKLVL